MKPQMKCLELAQSRPTVGFGVALGSLRIVEMVSTTPFDFVMVDMLHSHFDKAGSTDALRVLALAGGPVPLGRVAANEAGQINDLLDAGAMGIIVPMVNSAAEAKAAVRSTYYPPIGDRSKGSPAAMFYGDEYYDTANTRLSLIVMIETIEAVDRAEEILAVPGISGCLIGAGDLAFTIRATQSARAIEELVDRVVVAGRNHAVPVGISVGSPEDLERWWQKGLTFFLASHDMGVLNTALNNYAARFIPPQSSR